MDLKLAPDRTTLGARAAADGAEAIRGATARKGACTIILATGASQFEMLDALVAETDIDWSKVTVFHLDEYVGLPATHDASFRRYLQERFIGRVPRLGRFVPVEGEAADLPAELDRLNRLIAEHPVDVCFAGIGENGHLAFNDPPADFEAEDPYILVTLDEACRRQQLGEGWFPTFDDIPRHAVSMSIRQMLKSERMVLSVPDARKARAVQAAVEGPVSPDVPASALQRHADCVIWLDPDSAALLKTPPAARGR